MVPSAFVSLESFPLTPNGKIDLKALPAPDGQLERELEYVAPRNPREEIIANIFANVLQLTKVGIHDNFFELGGHSLLAIVLISRLREALKVEIPVEEIFNSSTVAQLEIRLSQLKEEGNHQVTLPGIKPRDSDCLLYTSPSPRDLSTSRMPSSA